MLSSKSSKLILSSDEKRYKNKSVLISIPKTGGRKTQFSGSKELFIYSPIGINNNPRQRMSIEYLHQILESRRILNSGSNKINKEKRKTAFEEFKIKRKKESIFKTSNVFHNNLSSPINNVGSNKDNIMIIDNSNEIKEETRLKANLKKEINKKQSIASKIFNTKKKGPISNFLFNVETHLNEGISYEETKIIEFLYRKNTMNSLYQFCFSLFSIISAIMQVEFQNNNAKTHFLLIAEWFCFISSIGLWITFFMEYWIDCSISHYLSKLPENLWRKNFWKLYSLIFKLVIFFLHPNPIFQGSYIYIHNPKFHFNQKIQVNSILCTICMFRLWFFFKLLITFSEYSSARTDRACKINYFNANFSFYMKALLDTKPYNVYGTLMVLCIFFSSYNIRIYERGLDDISGMDFSNFINCVWCVIITMTTVGFGDYFPSSVIGRTIGIFSCFMGVFLISMLVVTITNLLNLKPHELNVWYILERSKMEKYKIDSAKKVLSKYLGIVIKSKKELKKQFEANNTSLKQKKYNFLEEYYNYKQISNEHYRAFPKISEFDLLNENMHFLDEEFSLMEFQQTQLNEKIDLICEKLGINYNETIEEQTISNESDEEI